jgi:type IV secretory pathway protease TraF
VFSGKLDDGLQINDDFPDNLRPEFVGIARMFLGHDVTPYLYTTSITSVHQTQYISGRIAANEVAGIIRPYFTLPTSFGRIAANEVAGIIRPYFRLH